MRSCISSAGRDQVLDVKPLSLLFIAMRGGSFEILGRGTFVSTPPAPNARVSNSVYVKSSS